MTEAAGLEAALTTAIESPAAGEPDTAEWSLEDGWPILACPGCHEGLVREGSVAACTGCRGRYPVRARGGLDLRLRAPTRVASEVVLGVPVVDSLEAVRLDVNPAPAVDPDKLPLAGNVSARFVSYLPGAPRPGARVLDLGCGRGVDRPLLEAAGYQWHGIDLYEEAAPILADGQALPFKDGSFDLVFSVAVFECFQYPNVALREVARVLRPGGRLMASVAFLTPYIPLSQFHWSHVGAINALRAAGLDLEVLMADRDWSALEAAATLGLFPRMPPRASRGLVRPLKGLHRLWWRIGATRAGRPLSEAERVLRNAGDIEFVAVKP